jgi:hypothetical protein
MTGWKVVFLSVAVAALMLQDTASAVPGELLPFIWCIIAHFQQMCILWTSNNASQVVPTAQCTKYLIIFTFIPY